MKQYKQSNENNAKIEAYQQKYRLMNVSPERKAKHNEYKRNYRKMNASPEKNSKAQ